MNNNYTTSGANSENKWTQSARRLRVGQVMNMNIRKANLIRAHDWNQMSDDDKCLTMRCVCGYHVQDIMHITQECELCRDIMDTATERAITLVTKSGVQVDEFDMLNRKQIVHAAMNGMNEWVQGRLTEAVRRQYMRIWGKVCIDLGRRLRQMNRE